MQIVFEAEDPAAQAKFWAQALGYVLQATAVVDPSEAGPRLVFQRVAEAKAPQNRIHLDLQSGGGPEVTPAEQRRRVELAVERLTELGATYVLTTEDFGIVWAVMVDPEGNEFSA